MFILIIDIIKKTLNLVTNGEDKSRQINRRATYYNKNYKNESRGEIEWNWVETPL